MMSQRACPQITAAQVARDHGFTPRHWTRLAAEGKIPGARQLSGPRGRWLFDRRIFKRYAQVVGLIPKAPLLIEKPPRKPLRQSRPDDLVYAMYSAGHIKFGVSSNVTRRRHSFTTASPAPVVLLATVPGSIDLELGIQRRFAIFRVRGEWFRLSPEVRTFVEQMQKEGTPHIALESAELEFRRWLAEQSS